MPAFPIRKLFSANGGVVLMQTNPLSDVSSRKKRERMPKVSFARDIKPLFRAIDISRMRRYGIKLDDYTFMSKPDNAGSWM
jgi:hypothetical protein